MARPTAQAQDAIDRLKAAGLKRSEFSVKTERHRFSYTDRNGYKRQMVEYGNAIVSLKCSPDRAREVAPAVAKAGLHVELVKLRNGKDGYPHISTTKKPGLYLRDFTATDDGWGKVTKINA